jgi:exodeoxyribonuclease VII large subunit
VDAVRSHRVFEAERGRLRTYAQRVDDLSRRAETGARRRLEQAGDRRRRVADRLEALRWDRLAAARRERITDHARRLGDALRGRLRSRGADLARAVGKLESLSPLAVLQRGYALLFDERGALVQRAGQVAAGDVIDVRLHEGALRARVSAPGKADE